MARLAWGAHGERFFETGTDRGVLYLPGKNGVPWNGLKAVNEAPTGGEPRPYYLDGYKYLNVASSEEYSASLEAFSSPQEFAACDGTLSIHNGLFVTQQPRSQFGLSYRTLVGNDRDGADHGYKIHIVYNALAAPSQRSNQTKDSGVNPLTLSWSITTQPPLMAGIKPTAHFVIDSRYTPSGLLRAIEDILYGSIDGEARLPSVQELTDLFRSDGVLLAVNLLTNPGFVATSGTVEVARSRVLYPGDAPTGTIGWSGYRTTLSNPGGYIRSVASETSDFGNGGIGANASNRFPVTPGEVLTLSAELRGEGYAAVGIQLYDSAGEYISGTQQQGAAAELLADWRTVTLITDPAPANAATARPMILRSSTTPVGMVLEMRRWTDGNLYPFSGNYSYEEDFVPSFVGGAQVGPSILTGKTVTGVWTSAGQTRDYRVLRDGVYALHSHMRIDGPKGINLTGMADLPASGDFTMLLRVRASRVGNVTLRLGGSHLLTRTLTTNWQDLRVFGSSGGVGGATGLLITPGAAFPMDSWIEVMKPLVVEGPYNGPYFDGNTIMEGHVFRFQGAANASRSEHYSWYF